MENIMEDINKNELNRRIFYWEHALGKIENRMIKEHAERVDIKSKLIHLYKLR